MTRGTLEICVDDSASLRAAVEGGADRIELCSALPLGGLTPSPSFTAEAVATGLPIHPMVRPRAGDFVYDEAELALIEDDIRRLRDLGIAGVVVGAAVADGRLDERALARFRSAADGLRAVLHRVIDLTPDPVAAARIAAKHGYDLILTSGGAPGAFEGRAVIAEMVEATRGKVVVMAGAGISAENVADIVRDGRVTQIHGSASAPHGWRDSRIQSYGFAYGPRRTTDAAKVVALRQALTDCLSNGETDDVRD